MNSQIVLAALVAILLTGPAGPASAQPRADLSSGVARAVSSYDKYTVFDDVRANVEGTVVTLSGKVTMPGKREEIGKRVAAVEGVTTVKNEIDVLAPSPSDDDLRRRVARAIYGNAAFWRYASMPTPPIRILVERGRVTLTGNVATESDRLLARSLATGLGETSLTCELTLDRAGR